MIVFFFEGVDEALEGVEEEGVFGAEGVRGVRLPLERALPRCTGVLSPEIRDGDGV